MRIVEYTLYNIEISILFGEPSSNYLSIKLSSIRLLFTHFTLKLKREFNFNKRLKIKIMSIVHNLCILYRVYASVFACVCTCV